MNHPEYRTFTLAMPVVMGEYNQEGDFIASGEILGTCFSLGGSFMLSASHVINSIKGSGAIGIVDRDTSKLKAVNIVEKELLSCDVAMIKVDDKTDELKRYVHTLPWITEKLSVFSEVSAIGYPHGKTLMEKGMMIYPRGFKGYVVSNPNSFLPLGYQGSSFAVYELNFQAPAGLSGSPLLTPMHNKFYISGVIIGNSSSKILVLENEEIIQDKSGKTVVQQYESMSLGIAVAQTEILGMPSTLLGTSIQEYLGAHGLL